VGKTRHSCRVAFEKMGKMGKKSRETKQFVSLVFRRVTEEEEVSFDCVPPV
jgi:hypothetical protein